MNGENFAAFILTHGRPDRVYTLSSLKKHGYTGRVVLVVDNEDKTIDQYVSKFGDMVNVFDKKKMAESMDEADNFNDRRAIIYARNASFEIAKKLGIEYFIQLDDDYTRFVHKRDGNQKYKDRAIWDLDAVLLAMLSFYKKTPALSIAMAQTGDYIGGASGKMANDPNFRKCMNSFICSTKRPFKFSGRINEDVNTYTTLGSRGNLFLTIPDVCLQQKQTQKNKGGMTDLYLDSGTYVKSFYSIMFHPSSVKIGVMNTANARIHHKISWRHTVPLILPQSLKK